MVELKLKITYADGTVVERLIAPRVIVAFERHFKTGFGNALEERRYEHFLWMAWEAERVAGTPPKPFDDWLDGISGVEPVQDDRPTEATA